MKNEFAPYDIALAVKDLGFNEKCLANFMVFGDNELVDGKYGKTEPKLFTDGEERDLEFARKNSGYPFVYHACKAPLYQQLFRWFREEYNLHCNITNDEFGYYTDEGKFNTYEEAQNAYFRKLIEIVKNEKVK